MKDTIYRQEAIDEFWKLDIEMRPSAIDAITGILEQLPSAQPESKWIPCSERLPEVDVFVLVTLQHFNGEIDVIIAKVIKGYFSNVFEWESDDGEWTWDIGCGFAWMPLPEPYKGEQK